MSDDRPRDETGKFINPQNAPGSIDSKFCSTCGGKGRIDCLAHVKGDGCCELTFQCPDCDGTGKVGFMELGLIADDRVVARLSGKQQELFEAETRFLFPKSVERQFTGADLALLGMDPGLLKTIMRVGSTAPALPGLPLPAAEIKDGTDTAYEGSAIWAHQEIERALPSKNATWVDFSRFDLFNAWAATELPELARRLEVAAARLVVWAAEVRTRIAEEENTKDA